MATLPYPHTFEEFRDELDKFLHGNEIGILKDIFQKIEHDFQVRRLNIVQGFLACLLLFFLVSDGAHFLCNFIGFVYPAYFIVRALEQGHAQLNCKKWLTYWIIYSTFNFAEYFLRLESPIWRLYWLVKCIGLVLCFIPVQWNGSERLYHQHISPFLQNHRATINAYFVWAWESTNKGIPPFVFLYCAYMWGFRFLCNILGFLYPAYISMVTLMGEPEVDRMHWMTYWIIYSGCSLSEYILSVIPLYYPIKFILLGTYLLEPLAQKDLYNQGRRLILWYRPINGASRICHSIINFFLTSHQASHQMKRSAQGAPTVWNIAHKNNQITVLKAQHAAVDPSEVDLMLSSPMVRAVLEMNVEVELVKKAIMLKLAQDGPGHNFTSAEALLEAVFNLSTSSDNEDKDDSFDKLTCEYGVNDLLSIPHTFSSRVDSQVPLEVIEENRQLKEQLLCKICMTEEVGMAFVPCGHFVCCFNCAFQLNKCPICRMEIESSLRTYMS